MAAHRRPIPDDFEEHKHETYVQLRARYHTHCNTLSRWLNESGGKVRKRERPVVQLSMDDEFIKRYRSITEAKKAMYGTYSYIAGCCHGIYKEAYGYKWRFEDADISRSI